MLIGCFICLSFIFNLNLFSQNTFVVKFKIEDGNQGKDLIANYKLDGIKYMFQLKDVNNNGKFSEKGNKGDALNIYSKNNIKQIVSIYLKDTISITFYDKTFYITNLDKSISQKKLIFHEMPFNANSDITFRNQLPNVMVKDLATDKEELIENFLPDTSYQYFIINAWATGCAPCINDIKYLSDVQNKYGIGILNISMDSTHESDNIFAANHDMVGKSVYLELDKLYSDFNIHCFPTTILYSKDRKLVHYFLGITEMLNFITRQPGLIGK